MTHLHHLYKDKQFLPTVLLHIIDDYRDIYNMTDKKASLNIEYLNEYNDIDDKECILHVRSGLTYNSRVLTIDNNYCNIWRPNKIISFDVVANIPVNYTHQRLWSDGAMRGEWTKGK